MKRFSFKCFNRELRHHNEGDFYNIPDHDWKETGETCEQLTPFEKAIPRRITHVDIHELTEDVGYPEDLATMLQNLREQKATCTYITTDNSRYKIDHVRGAGPEIERVSLDNMAQSKKWTWIKPTDDCATKLHEFIRDAATHEPLPLQNNLRSTFFFFACAKDGDKLSASEAFKRLEP